MAWILVLWLEIEDGFLVLSCHNEVTCTCMPNLANWCWFFIVCPLVDDKMMSWITLSKCCGSTSCRQVDPQQTLFLQITTTRKSQILPIKMKKTQENLWLLKTSAVVSGLCSSGARWPLVPNFCPWATRKSQTFHTNHMLGTLDFTVSEHWAPFNFPQSTALGIVNTFLTRWLATDDK